MVNGGQPGVRGRSVVLARLEKLWNAHPPVVIAGVAFIAFALAVALIWPITDLIAAHDVGLITGSKRAAALQTAREAVRTQLLTLGAGLFAAGALIFTARNFTLSRRTFDLTEQGQVPTGTPRPLNNSAPRNSTCALAASTPWSVSPATPAETIQP
jgi:hypothetical protein